MERDILLLIAVFALSLITLLSPASTQSQTLKITPQTPTLKRAPAPQLEAVDPRIMFGESNNTTRQAYLLQAFAQFGRRYHAGFGNGKDVDYYKFIAPSSGFGSWFKIDVQSIEPQNFQLYVTLLSPIDETLEQIAYESSGSLWISLKKGVEAKIIVSQGELFGGRDHVYYDIGITFGLIPDSLEDDDTKARATLLTFGSIKSAYMGGVLDGAGQPIGLSDWFKYQHRPCRNDCVAVSSGAYLELCRSPIPDDCEGCSNNGEGTSVCAADGCEGDGWGTQAGIRYVHVRHPEFSPNCYGQGNVPIHYTTPYTIRLSDNGAASFDDDCVP